MQYKLLYTICNSIEVYEDSVLRTKKILHHAIKFMAGEENRIVYESLYWYARPGRNEQRWNEELNWKSDTKQRAKCEVPLTYFMSKNISLYLYPG